MTLQVRRAMLRLLAPAILTLAPLCSAIAQGTVEQREACTPDALKLCSDTIPDVARTTACMRRHEAELSPRCHAVLVASDPDGASAPAAQRARGDGDDRLAERGGEGDTGRPDVRYFPPGEGPDEAGPGYDEGPRNGGPRDVEPRSADRDRFGPSSYGTPGPYGPADFGRDGGYGREPEDGRPRPGRRAQAVIARLCAAGEIDPRTCDETQRALQRNHRD